LPGKDLLLRKFYLFTLAFILTLSGSTQEDSCSLRVSLLTCTPGTELYSTFGHSAMRVQDAGSGTDVIFNYGTFEFGPDFYTKFIKGKLLYFLSTENYADFVSLYAWDKRGIQEQVLLLSCKQKSQLVQALYRNSEEANKFYRYDFLFDNCSTRLRDITASSDSGHFQFGKVIPENAPTFRNLIHSYLDAGQQYWSKLGIDVLLGSGMDVKVTNEQAMFLPDYLMKSFAGATLNGHPVAAPAQVVLQDQDAGSGNHILHPMVVFGILLLLISILSFVHHKKVQRFIHFFDVSFFLLLGLIGVLLVFMWLGTDHMLCRNNWNLLWALPTHAPAAFFLRKKARWMQFYLLVTIIIQTILLIGWIFLPQELNISLLPIVLLVLLRSWLIILQPHSVQHA
jgi:hypothetical protein